MNGQEIYNQGTSADQEIFGYKEAGAEYRYMPNRTSGFLRSPVAKGLDIGHLGDNYTKQPILDSTFIQETETNVDRTLAIKSTTAPQFIADFGFTIISDRPLPTYSVPGINKI